MLGSCIMIFHSPFPTSYSNLLYRLVYYYFSMIPTAKFTQFALFMFFKAQITYLILPCACRLIWIKNRYRSLMKVEIIRMRFLSLTPFKAIFLTWLYNGNVFSKWFAMSEHHWVQGVSILVSTEHQFSTFIRESRSYSDVCSLDREDNFVDDWVVSTTDNPNCLSCMG
jgi:hypothetical protein